MKRIFTKRYQLVLCISLLMMLLGGFMASMIQSNFGKVRVEKFKLPTGESYYLTGLLLIPPNATADNPVPLIITCHGSYNTKEMQDQNFVEWSRRGYAVIAMDAYDHGTSSLAYGNRNLCMVPIVEYA